MRVDRACWARSIPPESRAIGPARPGMGRHSPCLLGPLRLLGDGASGPTCPLAVVQAMHSDTCDPDAARSICAVQTEGPRGVVSSATSLEGSHASIHRSRSAPADPSVLSSQCLAGDRPPRHDGGCPRRGPRDPLAGPGAERGAGRARRRGGECRRCGARPLGAQAATHRWRRGSADAGRAGATGSDDRCKASDAAGTSRACDHLAQRPICRAGAFRPW